jgi:hypothetical protein
MEEIILKPKLKKTFLTRKKGTVNQRGQKFPVIQKLKLPARITGGKRKANPNRIRQLRRQLDATPFKNIWKRIQINDQIIKAGGVSQIKANIIKREKLRQSYLKYADDQRSKLKRTSREFTMKDDVWSAFAGEISKAKDIKEIRKIVEEYNKPFYYIQKRTGGKYTKKFVIETYGPKAKLVTYRGKQYIIRDPKEFSKKMDVYDPILDKFVKYGSTKHAGWLPVRETKERKSIRAQVKHRLKLKLDPAYEKYMKDMGMSKKKIAQAIAKKVRAVKYPTSKRGPSYKRYLQKLMRRRKWTKRARLNTNRRYQALVKSGLTPKQAHDQIELELS